MTVKSKFYNLIFLLLALALVACGGGSPPPTTSGGTETESETTSEITNEEPVDEEPQENEPAPTGDRVEIRWFVGIGTGSAAESQPAQEAVVEAFNASQDRIELKVEFHPNDDAFQILNTQIAAGNPPDIIGPMGVRGRASFPGAWLDLAPLIESNNYDLSDFDPALVDFYRVEGEGQIGLPFAVYPSFLYINTDLFDESGLPYPPQEYGQPYVNENGDELEWNMETLRELSLKLTVDANGNDATSPDFDPNNIIQFGFGNQYTDLRGLATFFGAGNLIDERGNAQFPEHWREAVKWYHQAMWEDYFHPNNIYGNSTILSEGNWFDSGNLAIANVHLWYSSCCLTSFEGQWTTAVVPSYNDTVTAKLHADTFGIMKFTEHPDETFEVLSYLLGEKANELAQIYGGMPARLSLQTRYIEGLSTEQFPDQDINWDVAVAGLSYPDSPNHEEGLPSSLESTDRYEEFAQLLRNEAELDIDGELDRLIEDLQAIYDAANN